MKEFHDKDQGTLFPILATSEYWACISAAIFFGMVVYEEQKKNILLVVLIGGQEYSHSGG